MQNKWMTREEFESKYKDRFLIYCWVSISGYDSKYNKTNTSVHLATYGKDGYFICDFRMIFHPSDITQVMLINTPEYPKESV